MIWSRVTVMCSLGSVEGTQGPSPGPPNRWTCNLNLRTGRPRVDRMAVTEQAAPQKKERWTAQWAELFDEVVTSGLCTGCAGCVVACPHDVRGYDDTNGV